MSIIPALIFLALLACLLASAFLLYRGFRRRQRMQTLVPAIAFVVLAFYFVHVALGPFQRSPQKTFQYALGFSPPAGCTDLLAYEEQGFHPGANIWLRFQAPPQVLASIISQAHFSSRTAQDFSNFQKQQPTVDWWAPPSKASFWHSREFSGPYSFHDAALAYDTNSQTAFVYVTGLD